MNGIDLTCAGGCVELARKAFEQAASQEHSGSAEIDALTKRFRLLRDVDATDQHKEAEINLEHALALYEARLGQEHPAVARIMLTLADVYRSHGDPVSADYMKSWANEILTSPKNEPEHEFFHLFGMNQPDEPQESAPH